MKKLLLLSTLAFSLKALSAIQGTLEVRFNEINPQNPIIEYAVQTNHGKVELPSSFKDLEELSGSRVEVDIGQNTVSVLQRKSLELPHLTHGSGPIAPAHRVRSLAVLPISFDDSLPIPHPNTTDLHDYVFNQTVNFFFTEASFDRISFSGVTYPWTTYHNPLTTCPTDWNEIKGYVAHKVLANHVDMEAAEGLLILLNCKAGTTGGGYSYLDKVQVTLNGITYTKYLTVVRGPGVVPESRLYHELGHSLGLGHSNSVDCNNLIWSPNASDCRNVNLEYGNFYSIMGSWQGYGNHFTAWEKNKKGWLKEENILDIKQSGTYSLSHIENESNEAQMAIIRSPYFAKEFAPVFILDYKTPVGYDSVLNFSHLQNNVGGLFVYLKSYNSQNDFFAASPQFTESGSFDIMTSKYLLLDMRPTTSPYQPRSYTENTGIWESDVKNVTLQGTYNDPKIGIKIEKLYSNSQEVDFKVTYSQPQCLVRPSLNQFKIAKVVSNTEIETSTFNLGDKLRFKGVVQNLANSNLCNFRTSHGLIFDFPLEMKTWMSAGQWDSCKGNNYRYMKSSTLASQATATLACDNFYVPTDARSGRYTMRAWAINKVTRQISAPIVFEFYVNR